MKKNKEMICCECNLPLRSITELSYHVLNEHKMSFQEYSLKHTHSSVRPLCKCGCGKETPWHDCKKSYINFLKGHSINPSGVMVKCHECNDVEMDENSLGKHLRSHKMLLVDYIIKHELNGIHPVCECGCGEETKWINSIRSFSKTIDGHDDRTERNAKISATVKKLYNEPLYRLEISRLTKEGMNNEKTKSRMSELATNRCVNKVSDAEKRFAELLTTIFGVDNVKSPARYQIGHSHFIIDCFISCLNAYVEFDGLYWHCLKKTNPNVQLSERQCHNAASDLKKNRLFKENKLTLVRIAEGLDFSDLEPTLESLIKYSHYATVDGKVLKDEMPVLSVDKIRESSKTWRDASDVERLISRYESERSLVVSHV